MAKTILRGESETLVLGTAFRALCVKAAQRITGRPAENKAHLKCVQHASALKSLIQPFPELLLGQCFPFNRCHPALQHRNKKGHYWLAARRRAFSPAPPRPARAFPGSLPLPTGGRRGRERGLAAWPGRAGQGRSGLRAQRGGR